MIRKDASTAVKIGTSAFQTWLRLLEVNELYVLVVRSSCRPSLEGVGNRTESVQTIGHSNTIMRDTLFVWVA